MTAAGNLRRTVLVCVIAIEAVGCSSSSGGSGSGGSGGGGGTAPPVPPAVSLTGNYQFQTSSTGTVPFNTLSGFVNEANASTDGSYAITASLQVQSDACFAGIKVLDLGGYTKSPLSELTAFPYDSQTVTLNLSQNCTGVSLCGSYTVAGGCADKASGTIVGTKYATLSGTFQTDASASPALRITIKQTSQGTGQGSFQVSGSTSFTGAGCLTSGTIDEVQSSLSGSSLHLVAATDSTSGAPLTLGGTIDPGATILTVNSINLAGSNCLDSFNGSRLSLKQ